MTYEIKLDYKSVGSSLKQLTNAQIDALVTDYNSNKYSVSELVKKYNLKVYPNQLFRNLPLRIVYKRCPYDNHYLDTHLRAKYASNDTKYEAFCPKCYHKDVSYCHCNNCKNYRKDKEQGKKYLALQRFIINQYQNPLVDIKDIDMKDIVYLSILAKYYGKENDEHIESLSKCNRPLLPLPIQGNEYESSIMYHLIQKHVLIITSDSPIEAFSFDDKYKVVEYNPLKVNCKFHIKGDQITNNLKNISYYLTLIVENVPKNTQFLKNMNFYVTCNECIEYFYYALNKVGFDLPHDDKQSANILYFLIHYFSEKQIFYMMYKETTKASRYYLEHNTSKEQASEFMITNLKKYAQLILDKGWNVYEMNWPQELNRSSLTQFLCYYVLKIFDPKKYNFYPKDLF